MKNWKALKNEWTAIIVAHRSDDERLVSQVERLVERWDGEMEDTGGGIEVGFVRLGDDASATITDESILLWVGSEPYIDLPTEEVFASEVVA